jgi:hypothetical protein
MQLRLDPPPRELDRRLLRPEVDFITHLLKLGAGAMPVRALAKAHLVAVELWKLDLVNIWHRQSRALRRPEGPFYSLTLDGKLRAESLYLSRENRAGNASREHAFMTFDPPPPRTLKEGNNQWKSETLIRRVARHFRVTLRSSRFLPA